MVLTSQKTAIQLHTHTYTRTPMQAQYHCTTCKERNCIVFDHSFIWTVAYGKTKSHCHKSCCVIFSQTITIENHFSSGSILQCFVCSMCMFFLYIFYAVMFLFFTPHSLSICVHLFSLPILQFCVFAIFAKYQKIYTFPIWSVSFCFSAIEKRRECFTFTWWWWWYASA